MNTLVIIIVVVYYSTTVNSQGRGRVKVVNGCNTTLLVQTRMGDWTSKQLNAGQEADVTFPFASDPAPQVLALRGCKFAMEMTCLDSHRFMTDQFNSLAEFSWTQDGQLWYDISFVDGYTTSVRMEPFIPGNPIECTGIYCEYNVDECKGNKIIRGGKVAGCQTTNKDKETDYSRSIKQRCPDVYTWSQDDLASKYTCFANPNNGLRITFYC